MTPAETANLVGLYDGEIRYTDEALIGPTIALLREGMSDAKRASHVEEIHGEFVAIDRALERLQPGDLCLVLVDQVEEALAHLAQRCAEA